MLKIAPQEGDGYRNRLGAGRELVESQIESVFFEKICTVLKRPRWRISVNMPKIGIFQLNIFFKFDQK